MKHEIDLPEFRTPLDNEWFYDNVTFDPVCCKNKLYRPYELIVKKTAPASQLDRIKAEYAEFDVVELDWDKRGLWTMKDHGCYDSAYLHTTAQSMRGFYKYVYEEDDGRLFIQRSPTWIYNGTKHPVAVLFTK